MYLFVDIHCFSVQSGHSLMSKALRCRGEVDTLVGDGEAVLDESLPPASLPTDTELS